MNPFSTLHLLALKKKKKKECFPLYLKSYILVYHNLSFWMLEALTLSFTSDFNLSLPSLRLLAFHSFPHHGLQLILFS